MSISVEVWGDYACFTRPEMKVERVSYDVMTPSAARGIIEAIYWHPGMRWIVDRIHVCAPIHFTSIRRNEITDKIPYKNVLSVMNNPNNAKNDLYLNRAAKKQAQQRAAMVLTNVRYVIDAHFEMTEKASASDNPGKFQDTITRRLAKGQCYHQPYFGSREFAANFALCEKLPPCPNELSGTHDLGWMLLDMDYSDSQDIKPIFFRASLNNGVLDVPAVSSLEVVR